MKILNKLTIKNLLKNKKRTIVSIIGIMLSTALMVGIGLLCSTFRELMIKEILDKTGNYQVSISEVNPSKLKYLTNNKKIDNYYYSTNLGYTRYYESDNTSKIYYFLLGGNNNYLKKLKITEGRLPNNNKEVILSNHIFSYSDITYKIGDTIYLSKGKRIFEGENLGQEISYQEGEELITEPAIPYTIVGFCERANATFEPYHAPGFSIFTKENEINTANSINIYLNLKNPKNIRKTINNIATKLDIDASKINYNEKLLAIYGQSKYNNINSFLTSFMIIFLSIISVACIFVIYNSFAISVMERKKQFGLFSSVGATSKQLKLSVLYEALILGIIGIIIGIISAYIGIYAVVLTMSILLKDIIPYQIELVTYPIFVIIPIIFMALVIIISAYIPSKKASKISPIEAIRQNTDIQINKKKIKTLGIVKKIFGIEGEIALKNIKRNKKKYRIAIISLFISIVTFISFSTYLDLGTKTTEEFIGTTPSDISIYMNNYNTKDNELINQIIKDKSTTDYIKTTSFVIPMKTLNNNNLTNEYLKNTDINPNRETDFVTFISIDNKSYNQYKKEIDMKEDKLIVTTTYNKMNYTNGNRKYKKIDKYTNKFNSITLCTNSEKDYLELTKEELNKLCNIEIKDIYKTSIYPKFLEYYSAYLNTIIITNEKTFEYYYNLLNKPNIIATTYLNTNDSKNIDKISENLTNYSYYENLKERKKQETNIIIIIKILLYGFISLVTLIGITSVFNTINTSIMLRKKEFAVLRSLGLTNHGFNKMIFFESIMFGIKSLFYGIIVGTLLSFIINNNMNKLVSGEFYLPTKSIIISTLGVFIIVLITMFYSVKKIKHENILEAIREENI